MDDPPLLPREDATKLIYLRKTLIVIIFTLVASVLGVSIWQGARSADKGGSPAFISLAVGILAAAVALGAFLYKAEDARDNLSNSQFRYLRWLVYLQVLSILLVCSSTIAIVADTSNTVKGTDNTAPAVDTSTYSIGGTVSGMADVDGQLTLINNGGNAIHLSSEDNTFTFSKKLSSGASFNVTVKSAPDKTTCSVRNGQGKVSHSNVTDSPRRHSGGKSSVTLPGPAYASISIQLLIILIIVARRNQQSVTKAIHIKLNEPERQQIND
eukprot:g39113.t1